MLESAYPGLSDYTLKQSVLQMAGISAVAFEMALVETESEEDAQAVEEIFQARVDSQIQGGAMYPATIEAWENASVLVEGCVVTSIPLSHDAWGACGYRFDWQGRSLGVLTDTGIVPEAAACLEGVDILLLEANHDVEALLSGPYPYDLKERVMGRQGHLSNEAAAQFAAACALAGTRDIILAHLSEENNTPQMARSAVGRALEAVGYQGRLSVAPRREMGEVHVLEVAECSVSR